MSYLVGIDGGWSKTRGVLCDASGRVLAAARGRGSAIVGKPRPKSLAVLNNLLNRLCEDARIPRRDIRHVGLGLNGIDFADEFAQQHAVLCKYLKLPVDGFVLVNDGLAALAGVSLDARIALLQHGSGLTTAYRTAPSDERIFDHLDIGGLYDMRRDSFVRTARMIDGRLARSSLVERVLDHCGVSEDRFSEWAYRDPRAPDLRFTIPPVIFAAWRDGDPVAADMIARAADDYVLTMRAMAERMGPAPFSAAFAGGMIAGGGRNFAKLIEEKLRDACPQAACVAPRLPAEYGAVVLAAHRAGFDVAPLFENLVRFSARSVVSQIPPPRLWSWRPRAVWSGIRKRA